MGGAKRYPSSSRSVAMGIASLHPSYGACFMPRLERNVGRSAPTFRHAWTAGCVCLPSSAFFPEPPRVAHPPPSIGKTDVANQSALRSACCCGDGCAGRIGGCRAKSRSGQTGAQTVCRKLCVLPSQPARARQGPLSPHALSVSAKTLFQRLELGLGADVLSGIHRQRKARRGEACGQDRRGAITPVAAAGAGAGALGAPCAIRHDLLTATLRNLLSPAIFWTFAGLAS